MNGAEFALLALAFLIVAGALWLEYMDHKKGGLGMSRYEMGWCHYCLEPKPVRRIAADDWVLKQDTRICEQCDKEVSDEMDRKWREEYPR